MFSAFLQNKFKKIFINPYLNLILKKINQRVERYFKKMCVFILLENEQMHEVGFFAFRKILLKEILKLNSRELYPYTIVVKNCIENFESSNKSLLCNYVYKCFFKVSKFDLKRVIAFCKFIEQLKNI